MHISIFTKKKHNILLSFCIMILFISMFGLSASAASRLQQTNSPVIVVIDPGHGGENEGTTENGFLEKSMTMATALAMKEELEKFEGIQVYLTHTDDKDMSLKERAQYAQQVHADFLFSIHYNASETHLLFGSEVWISMQPKYHAYGYQAASMVLNEYEQMGMHIRGIKTRYSSKGDDYYGVIRESVKLGIPAIILEHCHVDHPEDSTHCDTIEEQQAFGIADAHAVAKYFGLKSSILDLDYSANISLPEVNLMQLLPSTLFDETPPVWEEITLLDTAYEALRVNLQLQAHDPESTILYYTYSLDGGQSFKPLLPWPNSNALSGAYDISFPLALDIPDGTQPILIFRAYNGFDQFSDSSPITFSEPFIKPLIPENEDPTIYDDVLFEETVEAAVNTKSSATFILDFLKIGIAVVGVLFLAVLTAQVIVMIHDKRTRSSK